MQRALETTNCLVVDPFIKEVKSLCWLVLGYHVTGTSDSQPSEACPLFNKASILSTDHPFNPVVHNWERKCVHPGLSSFVVHSRIDIPAVNDDSQILKESRIKIENRIVPHIILVQIEIAHGPFNVRVSMNGLFNIHSVEVISLKGAVDAWNLCLELRIDMIERVRPGTLIDLFMVIQGS